ncbi:ECF transporter S component [Paenibacillus senegalensis]|uniref:ECF transporter S component n=1 Tax=Paenibacillus senegalensis TaxID=1465766 RepID=UPI000288A919|nr:ECF transporter S component [Paenibacillus senegalensis]
MIFIINKRDVAGMEDELTYNEPLQRRRGAWNTKDILITGMIGVVFAFVLIAVTYAYFPLAAVLGPGYSRIMDGIFMIPGLMALYLIRKPGAGLVAMTIGGLVTLPFSPYGLIGIAWSAVAGLECETPFLAVRYRKYSALFLMISGSIATLISTLLEYPLYGHAGLSVGVQITMLAVTAVSGAIGGFLSKWLADATLKSGLLADYRRS